MKMDNERLEMLKEVMAMDFSLLDICLYLDTHPQDKRALDLHNDYVLKCNKLRAQYEDKYALLTQNNLSGCPWEWIQEPWPWEIDYKMGGR